MDKLILNLLENGIFLSVEKGTLKVRHNKSSVPEILLQEIRKNKNELLEYLGRESVKSAYQDIVPVKGAGSFSLSSAQRRLWVLSQFEGGSEAYNIPANAYLDQRIDIDCFKKAIDATIERHEILRTVFEEDEAKEIKQWVLKKEDLGFTIDYKDFRKEKNKNEKVNTYITEDSHKAFDLAKGPLLRAALLQTGDEAYVFYYNIHHIIGDGWSMDVLTKDVLAYYEAYKENKQPALKALRIQYKDYSAWQLAQLEGESFKAHRAYWLESLKGELPLLDLPNTKQRPRLKSNNGRKLSTYLNKEVSQSLKEYSQQHGGTVFMGLLASLNAILYRYTGQNDLIVGSPVAGREHADLASQIGFYVNTLALRNEVKPADSFDELFSRVKQNTLNAYAHQMYPFDKLVEELNLQRDTSRSAVFDVMLVFQNNGEKLQGSGLNEGQKDAITDHGPGSSKFDLVIDVLELGDNLAFSVEYNTDVYEKEMIESFMIHYKSLLSKWLADPEQTLQSIDYLPGKEREDLLAAGHKKAVYSKKTVMELFEEQAAANPGKTALVFENSSLTYKELNAQSNMLAGILKEKYNISRGASAGVMLERSLESVIAMIAIMKTGAAYFAINHEYPTDRVDYIIKDSKVDVIVSEAAICKRHGIEETAFVDIKKLEPGKSKKLNLKATNGLEDAAYIIYTSGSTGQPKGVVQTHRMMSNLVQWEILHGGIERHLKHLQYTSFSFDVSVQDYWAALCAGGTIYIANEKIRLDFSSLWAYILTNDIEVLSFPISAFQQLIIQNSDQDLNTPCIKHIVVSGEQLIINASFQKFLQANPELKLHNHYGPSETHLVTSYTMSAAAGNITTYAPVGKPVHNARIYILDASKNLVPQGVLGELYIGGDTLAIGYLNKEELTREKFIANPFRQGERMYTTGDLGRWLPDGNIEFIGRRDHQVKIRGYRIELGEIENALQSHKEIEKAVVLAKENQYKEKELVAYITAKAEQNTTKLIAYLKEILPEYMLPSYYVQLDELPLNTNGKVDKKALPEPKGLGLGSGTEYVAPGNETEEKLLRIWQDVLQREKVGIKDDFFALGGHSLKAVRLSNEYGKALNVKLSLKDLFAHTTVEAHAALIQASKKYDFIQIEKVAVQASYPISDAQRRLWVMSQFEGGSVAYNMPNNVYLSGSYDIENFAKAIAATIERHEILRTVFKEDETGGIRQWVLNSNDLGFTIDYKDFRKSKNKEEQVRDYITEDAYKVFDLEKGPLLRAALLRTGDEDYVFYYNTHHIISDGWSMEVLTKDVLAYYEAYKNNQQPQLKKLRIQYKDYSAWQLAQLKEESFKAHKAYWLERLKGELPLLDLPTTKQRPRIKTNNGHGLGAYIDRDTTAQLKKYSEAHGGSLFMGLLAGWNILMYRYTSLTDIITGTPTAGREHADLEEQIGFYVNTLALRNELKPADNFDELFLSVKQNTLNAYAHQMYPFDRLVEDLNLARDTSRSVVFDIMLILQNNGENINGLALKKEDINKIADLGQSKSKFDIEIVVQETGDYLSLNMSYNPDVYERDLVEDLIRRYKQLLKALLENPKEKISQIDYLSEKEKQELLVTFNDTKTDYAKDKSITDLFEAQATKTPDAIALVFKEKELTYKELNEQSNQLANYLQKNYQIQPDDLVGIKLERTEWMIISILAVLKSGGAYVPIDPEYPQERIDYIVADTQCKVCIDAAELSIFKKDQKKYATKKVNSKANANHLAYVIYTSGSTGKPKGVMIGHKSLSQFLNHALAHYYTGETIIQPFVSSSAFDISVFELFLPLLTGGQSILVSKEDFQDNTKFAKLLSASTVMHTVPAMYETIVNHIKTEGTSGSFSGIKKIFVGGDKVSDQILQSLAEVFSSADVTVLYGPTEGTIFCTDCVYGKEETKTKSKTKSNQIYNGSIIGTPNNNVSIYILNEAGALAPKGVTGEICIGGEGLAKGYLNQPALTKEKFIPNPFKAGEKIYKTGDLGRWTKEGNIEFAGRKDDQVKIRGYRIELGEIEHALLKHEQIEAAVVVAKTNEQNEKELVAYIVSKEEQTTTGLRDYLKELLPEYMLPAYYVQLEALPLTSNGKVDKKALPDPQGLGLSSGVEYVAPGNEVEEKLLKIWQTVLHKEKEELGIDEGFFAVGGNSIKLIALKSKIERAFKINCPVASLFQFSTIRLQADMLLKESPVEHATALDDLTSVFHGDRGDKSDTDIAVIGMSIKAPGSKNIYEFWDNLRSGRESITHFSEEELLAFGIPGNELNNKNYVRANSYLEDKECFDASFFGYLPDEAKLMDPQTRVFHEVVWSALEDSGYDPQSYKGLIGLYAGAASNMAWEAYSRISNDGKTNEFTADKLRNKDFLSALIAHKLSLKGPVNAINTACSTSLVAIHHAVRSILTGENHVAIAGGVSISNKQKGTGYLYQEDMIESKDGHNRAFDKDSSGTVGGEGAGAVVLKKLSAALEDGDHIYAIIKGSAINNDGGRKVGFTAPSVDGQSEVIRLAHKVANVSAESISYVEAHGTATKLGDPIEILALTQAFGKSIKKHCALGSVKTNIGHLDSAAGVAGFIKTVLCLKNKKLVPSLHFKSPNPEINFKDSPFYVNTELQAWQSNDFPLRAGVSSFGIGGTNAHVILEEAPTVNKTVEEASLQIITLSAKTKGALLRQQEELKEFLKENKNINLANVAWTLQNRRSFLYRSSFVAETIEESIAFLEKTEHLKLKESVQGKENKIAFMFPGQGSQYENMARGLYDDKESVFRKTMDLCFEISVEHTDIDFKDVLYPAPGNKISRINETINTQPILFMVEYALAKQLEYYGIKPAVMMGHSIGEYVAACFGGVLTLEGALQMVIKRAELMQALPKGAMLAVGMSAGTIENYLSAEINLAAVNAPGSCVLSGNTGAINKLSEQLEKDGIPSKLLNTSHAFHSVMMEPMLDAFTKAIDTIEIKPTSIPYISNLTGLKITGKDLKQKTYWADHIRGTVKFSAGLEEILLQDDMILIEVGPGNALSSFARQHAKDNKQVTAHQLTRQPKANEDDAKFLLNKISDLWQAGLEINWSHLHSTTKQKITLPTYSFEKIKYPMGGDAIRMISERLGQLNEERRQPESNWYYEPTWKKSKLHRPTGMNNKDDWYLIFCNEGSIGHDLIASSAMHDSKIIKVKSGSGYQKINEHEFVLNPYDYEGYEKLFNALKEKNIHPAHIVHLLSLDQNLPGQIMQEHIEKNKALGFYSLLHIAKELHKPGSPLPVTLSVVTNNLEDVFDNDVIHPSKALMAGISTVISQENPLVQSRIIDLALENNGEKIISDLAKEIKSGVGEKFIAYRNNARWIRDYNSLPMPKFENESKIKNSGTYLITGGLGGLGFLLAKYLLEKYKANLILVGRSEASKNEQKKGRRLLLQQMGNVSYHQTDISDLSAMQTVVEKAEKEFGKIDGLVHAAVAGEGNLFKGIYFLSVEESKKQFNPKVAGTQVLAEIFKNRELDFCLFTSSLSAIIGGKEFGSYAAANAYLDYTSRKGVLKNSVSINFEGLNFNEALNAESELNPEEIIKVFETVLLMQDDPQIIVSLKDLNQRVKKWVYAKPGLKNEAQEAASQLTPAVAGKSNLSAAYAEPQTKTEKELCQLFQSFFSISNIGIDDDFFELGGDSLKAMTLISRIHQKLNIQLRIKDLLENPAIRSLGNKIDLLAGINQMEQKRTTMNFKNKIEL